MTRKFKKVSTVSGRHEGEWFLVAENETALGTEFYPTAKAAEQALKKGKAVFELMDYPKSRAYPQKLEKL